jgi:hypothetical protein
VPVFEGGAQLVTRDGSRPAAAKALPLETLKNSIREDARRSGRPFEN